MQSHPPALEMAGLTKQFGRHRAVDSLNLAVHPGSVFGFLGPNGAGKTTTIRMLLGLIRPTQGGGRILGYDIERQRAAILPQVGAIVESPAFYHILSGRDNLRAFARTAGNEDARTIANVLEKVGLSERARDKVKTYSLGMKQRLAIAATLLNNPQIIFLDEPTNGLDPAGTVEIRELIGSLGASGHTIFLSSHLLHEVEQVCSEVAIINHGKLVAQVRTADLLKRDASLLIEAEPLATVRDVAARLGVMPQVTGPRTMTVALSSERAPAFVKALVTADAQVYQVTPQRTSLEHLFLELTGDDRANHDPYTAAGSQEQKGSNIMISLVRAGLFKLRKRATGWVMLVIVAAFAVLEMLSFAIISPGNTNFSFPGGFLEGLAPVPIIGTFVLIVLGAMLVGSEYGYDTWKNLLLRHAGRTPFILSKWFSLLVTTGTGLIVLLILEQLTACS